MFTLHRRSLLLITLVALALIVAACGGGSPGSPPGGSGPSVPDPGNGGTTQCPATKPCVITTLRQLQDIGKSETSLAGHYVLGDVIDAAPAQAWNNGEGFRPIGDHMEPFTGQLDGKGLSIKNLYINKPMDEDLIGIPLMNVGLFGYVDENARVTNLVLEQVDVTADNAFAGALAGTNEGTIEKVRATGKVHGPKNVGGLLGGNNGTIDDATSNVVVSGELFGIGGLVGSTSGDSVIRNSKSHGEVSGPHQVGGLVGSNFGTIEKSRSDGTVDGTVVGLQEGAIGGLVGQNHGNIAESSSKGNLTGTGMGVGGLVGISQSGSVKSSFAHEGVVTGHETVGGLVGSNADAVINDSWSTVEVNGSGAFVGGLVGSQMLGGIITRSYSTGNVSGDDMGVGGLVGNNNHGTIRESYSTGNVESADRGAGGLVGLDSYGTIEDSYSHGNVKGEYHVGGLIGQLGGLKEKPATVERTYSIGGVNGSSEVGGLVGDVSGIATVTASYWETNSGGHDSDGGDGGDPLTATEMGVEANYDNWDFTSVWEIVDGYPDLRNNPRQP